MGPHTVEFSRHSEKRIRQRGFDYHQVERLMYSLPYVEGMHTWVSPANDEEIVYLDYKFKRKVITTIKTNEGYEKPWKNLY